MKFFRRAREERTEDLIKLYGDTVRIEREPNGTGRRTGKWNVYKLKGSKFIRAGQFDDLESAQKLAKRV